MSDKQKHDYEFNLNIEGEKVRIRVNEIDPDLFKAVRPLLKDDSEKALILLKNAVIQEDRELYQSLLDKRKTKIILTLENTFAELLGSYEYEVKKK